MKYFALIPLIIIFTNGLAFSQTQMNPQYATLEVPKSYINYQGNDGTCYAYVAADYLNTVAGLTGRIRFRPKTSIAILAMNESSRYLENIITLKFMTGGASIFDGGYTDKLITHYGRSLTSLIPISEKLEYKLSGAVPFYETPKSFNDALRIKNDS